MGLWVSDFDNKLTRPKNLNVKDTCNMAGRPSTTPTSSRRVQATPLRVLRSATTLTFKSLRTTYVLA